MKAVVAVFLFLAGCSNTVQPSELTDAGPEDAQPKHYSYPEPDDVTDHGDPMCRRTEHIVMNWDGGSATYNIPLPCDPFWKMKDRGDPGP